MESALVQVLSKELRPLDAEANSHCYPKRDMVGRKHYDSAAPGRVHDFGKDAGEWACDVAAWDAIAKAEAARKTTQAAGKAEEAASPKAVLIVAGHVREKVLPELQKRQPALTPGEIAGTIGKPIDLRGKWDQGYALRGTGEAIKGWELTQGQIAFSLEEAKKKMDKPAECDACPNGGRRFALVKDRTARADGLVEEVCTNNQCMRAKVKARNATLDAPDADRTSRMA